MALVDVYLDVEFLDAAERRATVSYLMNQQVDTADWDMSAVAADAAALITALDVLTWDAINHAELRAVVHTASAVPNVSSNNQIHARSYATNAGGVTGSFDVPGWDDFLYDEDEFNLLSAAYNVLANNVLPYIRDPQDGSDFAASTVKRSVSRTHKSRGKKVV